jgi:pre-mRNA-processing factor 6
MWAPAELTISDIKQARQLLQNLIQTNPKHAPGWIAAASLEGKLSCRMKLAFG